MASVQMQYPIYGAIQKSEIRLLRMDRGWKGTIHDPLELSLVTFQDNNCPPYSALSYEWGSPLQSTFVLVNSQEISIRRNLYSFLVHLRQESGVSYIWADAICINQNDLQEKAEKVQQMDQVYENAAEVIAWVWPIDSEYPRDAALLSATFLAQERWSSPSTKQRLLQFDDIDNLRYLTHLLISPSCWTRRWIVQELVLAQDGVLMFYDARIRIRDVQQFFQALQQMDLELTTRQIISKTLALVRRIRSMNREQLRSLKGFERTFEVCQAAKICLHRVERRVWGGQSRVKSLSIMNAAQTMSRVLLHYNPTQSWADCLHQFHHFDCQHPLDVIYAIQGLVRTKDRTTVDYHLAPIALINHVLRVMASSGLNQNKAPNSNSRFLYASLLAKEMFRKPYRNLDEELDHIFLSPDLAPELVGQLVKARLTAFITGHATFQELCESEVWDRDHEIPPLRPRLGEDITSVSRFALPFADLSIKHGFWATPGIGRKFWERIFSKDEKGVFCPLPRSATCKERGWDDYVGQQFFIARPSHSYTRFDVIGISDFPVRRDDEIWQIPGKQVALVMRKEGENLYRMVSLAYLRIINTLSKELSSQDEITEEECIWSCLKLDTKVGRAIAIQIDYPMLLELSRETGT